MPSGDVLHLEDATERDVFHTLEALASAIAAMPDSVRVEANAPKECDAGSKRIRPLTQQEIRILRRLLQ